MLFNADIWQNFPLEEVNLEKQKVSKSNFHQKVKNMKPKFTLILDRVNMLSNDWALDSFYIVRERKSWKLEQGNCTLPTHS